MQGSPLRSRGLKVRALSSWSDSFMVMGASVVLNNRLQISEMWFVSKLISGTLKGLMPICPVPLKGSSFLLTHTCFPFLWILRMVSIANTLTARFSDARRETYTFSSWVKNPFHCIMGKRTSFSSEVQWSLTNLISFRIWGGPYSNSPNFFTSRNTGRKTLTM